MPSAWGSQLRLAKYDDLSFHKSVLDSSVSVVTRLQAWQCGVLFRPEARNLPRPWLVHTVSGPRPADCYFCEYSRMAIRAESNSRWSLTSAPSLHLHGLHKGQLWLLPLSHVSLLRCWYISPAYLTVKHPVGTVFLKSLIILVQVTNCAIDRPHLQSVPQ